MLEGPSYDYACAPMYDVLEGPDHYSVGSTNLGFEQPMYEVLEGPDTNWVLSHARMPLPYMATAWRKIDVRGLSNETCSVYKLCDMRTDKNQLETCFQVTLKNREVRISYWVKLFSRQKSLNYIVTAFLLVYLEAFCTFPTVLCLFVSCCNNYYLEFLTGCKRTP